MMNQSHLEENGDGAYEWSSETKEMAMPSGNPSCPNCPCHQAAKVCDGCQETLCEPCWKEHNENALCHVELPA
jgi:hypothetical protein